jgi:hypothetical protein
MEKGSVGDRRQRQKKKLTNSSQMKALHSLRWVLLLDSNLSVEQHVGRPKTARCADRVVPIRPTAQDDPSRMED